MEYSESVASNVRYLEDFLCIVGVVHSVLMSTEWREWWLLDLARCDDVGERDRLRTSTGRGGLAHRDFTGFAAPCGQHRSSGRHVLDLMDALCGCELDCDCADETYDEDSLPRDELSWLLSPAALVNDGESLRFSIFTFSGGAVTLSHQTAQSLQNYQRSLPVAIVNNNNN